MTATATQKAKIESLPPELLLGLNANHLCSLDGLRTIAVFLVIFYHLGIAWCPGGLGVLAFFVLSGFLITHGLLKEEERSGTIGLKNFYVRRTLRLFPAFYVFWFLVVGGILLGHKHIYWPQAIAAFFYVNNYYQAINGDPGSGFSHTWSLGVEEQFYLLWPVTFLYFRKHRLRFLCCSIVAVWLYRAVLVFGLDVFQGYIYEAFDARADHLLMGCLLAVLLRAQALPGLWRRICTPVMTWVTVGLLCASSALASSVHWRYRDTVGFLIDPMLVALLIAQSIATSRSGFGAILNWNWMKYLGRISYPLYLYQQVVMGPVERLVSKFVKPSFHWVVLASEVAAVIVVASLSYRIVEMPFLRLKKRFSA